MIRKLAVFTALMAALTAPAGWALTIGSEPATDVGLLDIFVHVSTKNELPNANPATEESWIESILGFDVAYAQYPEIAITPTNEDPTIFAWQLADLESDYFLVKNAAFWALYQNVGNLAYAVVDADAGDLPDKMNFGNATISHYGIVNGSNPPCQGPDCEPPCEGIDCNVTNPPTDIPVPAPLALMALALVLLRDRLRRAV